MGRYYLRFILYIISVTYKPPDGDLPVIVDENLIES